MRFKQTVVAERCASPAPDPVLALMSRFRADRPLELAGKIGEHMPVTQLIVELCAARAASMSGENVRIDAAVKHPCRASAGDLASGLRVARLVWDAAMRRALALLLAYAVGVTPGCALGPQKNRAGLWEVRGESIENPGAKLSDFVYRLCRDPAYDRAADEQLQNVKGCSTLIRDVGKGQYRSASTCKVGGTTIVSQGTTTYRKHESIHSETQATYTPPFNGKVSETLTEDQRYIRDCPADMRPGDILAADGIVRHRDPH